LEIFSVNSVHQPHGKIQNCDTNYVFMVDANACSKKGVHTMCVSSYCSHCKQRVSGLSFTIAQQGWKLVTNNDKWNKHQN
jgi:hypothetical protein